MKDLTHDRLTDRLHYDPVTGVFTWRVTLTRVKAGDVAGSINPPWNYRDIKLDQQTYKAHRLAWFYMLGEWPPHEIDHRNRVPDDNSWSNLRPATDAQQSYNTKVRKDSGSGVKGVIIRGDRFEARIRYNGEQVYLGRYGTMAEAKEVYELEALRLRGEFHCK